MGEKGLSGRAVNWEETGLPGQSLAACLDIIWLREVWPFILSFHDYPCVSYAHLHLTLADLGFHKLKTSFSLEVLWIFLFIQSSQIVYSCLGLLC